MAEVKSSLKIGFVLDGGLEKPDGVQQYILALGGWLKSQGHQVRYIVAGKIPDDITDAISLSRSIKVISNGNRLSIPLPANKSKLKAYLDNETFDILHVQTPYSPMMGERLVLLSSPRTAIIGTFHIVPNSLFLNVGDWLLGRLCYRSLKRFDLMLSVSSAAQAIAKRDFSIDSTILPNVIDFDRFHNALALERYMDSKLNILFFGRLVPRKGCDKLLEALSKLNRSNTNLPSYRVIICGSGPMESSLKEYVVNQGLEAIVEFVGFVDEIDKPRYYASADISIFPSTGGESFGIVLLEALSSGKSAVLAGNNVGYASVMKPRTEQLFDPRDIDGFANKIESYLTNIPLRQQATAWSSDYASEFDINLIGSSLLTIYSKVLRKRVQT
jgi:phosphatidylinositol alpha-mannosyltransferase